MNETLVRIPSEAEFTTHKPVAGWQVEPLTTVDEVDFAMSDYVLHRGRRPGMAMRASTWQILGSLLSNRAPMIRGEDPASATGDLRAPRPRHAHVL